MEPNPIILSLEDGEVVLKLAQPPGEESYITASLYKAGSLVSQKKVHTMMELTNTLKQFEVKRWT